jgi:hypothetical protein
VWVAFSTFGIEFSGLGTSIPKSWNLVIWSLCDLVVDERMRFLMNIICVKTCSLGVVP